MKCHVGLDGYFLNECTRVVYVATAPVLMLSLTVLFLDICRLLSLHEFPWISKSLYFLSRPFRGFLLLEDLAEFEGRKATRIVPPSWKIRAISAASVFQLLSITSLLVLHLFNNGPRLTAHVLSTGINFCCWFFMLLRVLIKRPSTPPYWLIIFSAISTLSLAIDFFHFSFPASPWHNIEAACLTAFRFADCLALLAVCLSYPIQDILPGPKVAPSSTNIAPSREMSSPEDSVTLWNWLTFNYMEPMFRASGKATLNDEDVWDLPPTFKHANLFSKYLRVQGDKPNQSLLWFLISSNSQDLLIDLALKMWTAVIGFVPPYGLSRILASLENHSASSHADAYFFALVTFLAHMSFAQLDLLQGWHSRRAYERTRGQLFCALHWKALKARDTKGKTKGDADENLEKDDSGNEGETIGIGRITNLMSGDAYAVAQRFWEFSSVFTAPVRLVIALVFLYRVLGWSSFTGVAVVLLAYIITWPLAKLSISITRSSWAAKDRRMSLVNELISSVRFLKYMGWETHWTDKVKASREQELSWRVKENVVSSIIAFLWTWIPSAVVLVAFSSYTVIAGKPLSVSKAFVSIEIFSQLQGPMAELPNQFFALLHAYVSMQRIENYLREPEVEGWATSLKREQPLDLNPTNEAVGFERASFKWHAASSLKHKDDLASQGPDPVANGGLQKASTFSFELRDISIQFPMGKLSLVTGPTGSGKSSLLAALLGEVDCISGSVQLSKANREVAYAGQFPFLEHATIRDNIVYHSHFEKARYESVLEACALLPDLAILDAGDLTEIGEKGVSLSGGQRARISLARAIYSRSKVVLLDDPLAAVDMHTARHLFTHCLSSEAPLMRNRTIVLVTHHVSLCLPATAYIVEMDHGRVVRQGFVDDLRERGLLARVIEAEDVPQKEASAITKSSTNGADLHAIGAVESPPQETDPTAGKLVDAESRAEGRVSFQTYLLYIKSAGWLSWILTFLLLALMQAITVGNQLFVAKWANAYRSSTSSRPFALSARVAITSLPSPTDNVIPWLLIYLGISLAGAFATLAYIVLGYWAGLQASRHLFIAMLDRVVRAPTRLFDKTPTGRILNRFVADIGAVDNALNSSARTALSGTLTFLASFGVVVYVIPRFAPFAIFIAYLYIRIAPPFVRTARDLRRLESISLSPAFAGFDELLNGLVHVRAFAMERIYQNRFYLRVDRFQSMDHVYWLAQMWLRWRYDVLGSIVVFLTTLFALLSGVQEGLAAVVIIQAGVFAEASRQLVRVLAQAELDFNSVERIKEYLEVDQEAPARVPQPPPARWPSSSGGIEVQDLVIRYAPNLPAALKGITFSINPREKVGVVGRTGSGKSTLALSLLRIIEASEGQIFLDGIDISTVGLDDLRGSVTIVSQDVALFGGSIRSNLDPFSEHTDAACWDVLERCHLSNSSTVDTPAGTSIQRFGTVTSLDMAVSAGGSSLSAGTRQLLALARAMLRRSAFVILDEASSSIDLETDDQIQRTIREELADSLVLTIAHRLKTILDYDRILVLGEGKILEFDTPAALFAKPNGIFRSMCEKSADWEELRSSVERSG